MPSRNAILEKLGWNESETRRTRLITGAVGALLLLCGVTCQWVGGAKVSDISLKTLCKAYTGREELNDLEDFQTMRNYYNAKYEDRFGPITLNWVASQFMEFQPSFNYPIDQFLTATPSFWCKYLPECPAGAECEAGVVINQANWTQGAWSGRPVSSKPHWKIPKSVMGIYSSRIRCSDKVSVYHDMLDAIFKDRSGAYIMDPRTDTSWNAGAVDGATNEVFSSCVRSKGSIGYILAVGPVLSTLACVLCMLILCSWFQGPLFASGAQGMALVAVAITLIDFWVIAFVANREYGQAYTFCGNEGAPLVDKGQYFDSHPCLDQNTQGDNTMNPFVSVGIYMNSLYTTGGIINLIATIILLVSIAKTHQENKIMKFQNLGPESDDI
mmetsp:Transcript_14892/g.23167  ORF Transcript_14892/g.23167 Transcript_14892/m.23167 type:complete len:384 (+) Transcript_14892:1027-2178(+)